MHRKLVWKVLYRAHLTFASRYRDVYFSASGNDGLQTPGVAIPLPGQASSYFFRSMETPLECSFMYSSWIAR